MKYLIPCVWQVAGTMVIEADSIEEAERKAEEEELPHGDYIDDSFELDTEHSEYGKEID